MRFANVNGRACVAQGEHFFDISDASGGRLSSDVQAAYSRWGELTAWFATDFSASGRSPALGPFGAPVPAPSQAFGIGLNYADHAQEAGLQIPQSPLVFPKFTSCIAGPDDDLVLDNDTVDWEVELVIVIGSGCRSVEPAAAWAHVAGLTIGQDISDRALQFSDPSTPQFGLGKSKPGYGPIGPVVVTADEFDDPSSLAITCAVNGEKVQDSNTNQLIFDVPALVSYLSSVVILRPGDIIFTGTPSGVGTTRTPPRYLRDGDVLVSEIEGIGALVTRMTR
ncbi:MAG: fumarylacetoacetate hydrolase family protein [Mycobacterium sp.]|uniref:fumarylacetoacetate hydrolase family protein n=1 Tax=Mycobacterium sp. TaxID=1785 RepID=UPI003C5B8432